jgi:exportin-2 (importin alpha re-exporter)
MQLPPHSDPERETEGDAAMAAVVANTSLFMEINEEEFAKYLQTFVQDVWTLLAKVSQEVRQVIHSGVTGP